MHTLLITSLTTNGSLPASRQSNSWPLINLFFCIAGNIDLDTLFVRVFHTLSQIGFSEIGGGGAHTEFLARELDGIGAKVHRGLTKLDGKLFIKIREHFINSSMGAIFPTVIIKIICIREKIALKSVINIVMVIIEL